MAKYQWKLMGFNDRSQEIRKKKLSKMNSKFLAKQSGG